MAQIFKEYGCGWGLKASEDVKKGQLVFEYVGEVIDDDELEVSQAKPSQCRHPRSLLCLTHEFNQCTALRSPSLMSAQRRLYEHAINNPHDHNMYIMELEKGLYLDARLKGNSSRFINHSCDPNCELQKWNVKGFTRIGIMALTDIPSGTPLSYDYQFATADESKFKVGR